MRLYTRLIIFTFLQYCILCEAQENENTDITNFIPTPTTTFSTSVNNTGDASSTISSTTTVEVLPTNSGSDGSGSTATSTNETSANFSTPVSFTASPTSSVLTYFPFPTRTGSSTSIISSGRPSPSAPFPDDTVGKNGRLHVSKASTALQIPGYTYYCNIITFCLILLTTSLVLLSF